MQTSVTEITFAKNGPGVVLYVWEIDHAKCQCWLEGDHYRFNRELISTHAYTHQELAKKLATM
jgi:hypothetical protein